MTAQATAITTFVVLLIFDIACWIGFARTKTKRPQAAVVSVALLAGVGVWLWALLAVLGR